MYRIYSLLLLASAGFAADAIYINGNVSKYLPDVNNPTSYNIDASFEKNTRIREGISLTFRGELFNALNTVIFSGPTTSITSSTFGKITLSQANTPRQVQFSLRARF